MARSASIKEKDKQSWPELLAELLHRLSAVILAVGVLLAAIGISVFLEGPSGPTRILRINGQIVPMYDFTRPFLGLDIAIVGLAIVISTSFVGNPLLGGLVWMINAIERSVSGINTEDPQDRNPRGPAGFFFIVCVILLALSFLFMAVLWSNLGPVPYILQPIFFDVVVRYTLFVFFLFAMTMVAFFLVLECLGSVLTGLRIRLTRRLRTPTTLKLGKLQMRYLYRELGSGSSYVSYMIIGLLAFLATSLESLREPLLVGALSLWAFAFAKSIFVSFQKACYEMGLKPEGAFKSERARGFLSMGVNIWNGFFFFLVWRLLLLSTLKPAAVFLSKGAVANNIAVAIAMSPFVDAMPRVGDIVTIAISQVLNDYLIYIIFLMVTMFAIYLYVLPEYFMRKSKRAFLRKFVLAAVVFSISFISQAIISSISPSAPSALYSSLIFVVVAIVVSLMQKSYEDAIAKLS